MLKPHTEIPKLAGVYRIVNQLDGKIYVGSTKQLRRRHRDHQWGLQNGVHSSRKLQDEYNQNGISHLKFEILMICESREHALPIEQYFLDKFKSYLPENGYNTSPTAETTKGVTCPESKKRKIGESNSGKVRPEHAKKIASEWTRKRNLNASPELKLKWQEARKRLGKTEEAKERARQLGYKNRGRVHTEETRKKIGEALIKSEAKKRFDSSRRKLSDEDIRKVISLKESGYKNAEILDIFRVSLDTLYRWIKKSKRGELYVVS